MSTSSAAVRRAPRAGQRPRPAPTTLHTRLLRVALSTGLAVGKAFAQGRPAWTGLAGLLAGSVSFYAAAALQQSLAAVILHADLPPGVLPPIVVAAIKAVEYGWLGAAVVWLERRNRGGL